MTDQSCSCTLSECSIAKVHDLKSPEECLVYENGECAYKIMQFRGIKVEVVGG